MAIPSIFRPAPMIHEASSTGSPRRCVHRLAMTCSLSGGISISNCTPFDGICQRTTGCFTKLHRGCGKIFGTLPNSLPRGDTPGWPLLPLRGNSPPGGPKGRERNSGGNLQARTTSQTFTRGATKTALRCRSSHFQNHYVAARIPHQSGNRFRRADSLTARNCGVIAPGNHWILDSLRGAPPPGEAMGAAAPDGNSVVSGESKHSQHFPLPFGPGWSTI